MIPFIVMVLPFFLEFLISLSVGDVSSHQYLCGCFAIVIKINNYTNNTTHNTNSILELW
jgi:hypothetical protein